MSYKIDKLSHSDKTGFGVMPLKEKRCKISFKVQGKTVNNNSVPSVSTLGIDNLITYCRLHLFEKLMREIITRGMYQIW